METIDIESPKIAEQVESTEIAEQVESADEPKIGIVYVVCGIGARKEAEESIRTLSEFHDWPIAVIGEYMPGMIHVDRPDENPPAGMPGRWAKVNLLDLSPFDYTLYLDADTRVCGKLDIGFRLLDDGWDLVIVPSENQKQPLHHLISQERDITLSEIGDVLPLMLNTGVMWFRRSERIRGLFREWQREWLRFKRHDQGALLRALEICPVRLWLLGRPYNGGDVVEHHFGMAGQ